jgi:hypothetical protein
MARGGLAALSWHKKLLHLGGGRLLRDILFSFITYRVLCQLVIMNISHRNGLSVLIVSNITRLFKMLYKKDSW